MTDSLRNRLVGGIIVVIAGIIIIPSLLDGRKSAYKGDFKALPSRPEFRSVQSTKSFPAKVLERNLPAVSSSDSDEVILDAAAGEITNLTTQNNSGTTVVNNETLSVTTMDKPLDFGTKPSGSGVAKPGGKVDKPNAGAVKAAAAKAAKAKAAKAKAAADKGSASAFAASAWVIQLGVFGNKNNADGLEKKLNAAGFVTFSRQIHNRGRSLTKVYVGPELERKILEKKLAEVNRLAGVKGTLTTFSAKR